MTDTTYHYLVGRMCYTNSIFKPFVPPGTRAEDKSVWGTTLLIDKADAEGDPKFAAYKQSIIATGLAKHGAGSVVNGKPTFEVSALKNGDTEPQAFKNGFWVVKTDSKWAIKVYGTDNSEVVEGSPDAQRLIYDGQFVMLKIKLDAWTYMNRKGVSARLQGIKILGGGTPENYSEGGNARDDLAENTPLDLPPSMKAAAAQAQQGGEDAFGDAPAPSTPMTEKEAEDIPW